MRIGYVPSSTKVQFRMSMPWEQPDTPPEIDDAPQIDMDAARREAMDRLNIVETVRALQADLQFMVSHTAILVRSDNLLLRMVFNTERGQSMPNPLKCTFRDGTVMEFQDIGMPQPGVPIKTIKEIVTAALEKAFSLGLQP
jgi:hypothetical protein